MLEKHSHNHNNNQTSLKNQPKPEIKPITQPPRRFAHKKLLQQQPKENSSTAATKTTQNKPCQYYKNTIYSNIKKC